MLFRVVLLCVVAAVRGQGYGQGQGSPCPEVFEYVNAGRQYEGLVKVPPRTPGVALKLTVVMYIAAQLPSNFAGQLSPYSDNDITPANSNTVNFRLDFPSQNPLPTIANISVNGETICIGQDVLPPPRFLTTSTVSFTIHPPRIINQPFQPSYYPTREYDAGNQQRPAAPARPAWAATPPPSRPPQRRPATPKTEPRPTPAPRPANRRPATQPKAVPAEDCGVAELELTQPLIQNGVPTQKGDWPWLVAIYYVDNDKFFCAGNLLDLSHVVTAAHCLQNRSGKKAKPAEIYVVVGKFNLRLLGETGNQRREVSQLTVHARYNFTSYSNDIAVLRLASPVTYTRYARPICLWRSDLAEERLVSRQAIVVGWGRDARGNVNTEHPEMAKAPIVSLDTCRKVKSFEAITNEMTLCAGFNNGTGPCTGDSGGGLMLANPNDRGADVRYYLQGIVSIALKKKGISKECNLHQYAVYTNVNKYLGWLRRFIVENYESS